MAEKIECRNQLRILEKSCNIGDKIKVEIQKKEVRFMKKISKLIFSRVFIVFLAIAVQFFWLFNFLWRFTMQSQYMYIILDVLAALVVLRIVSRWMNPSYKLAWTFIILIFPILGLFIYLVFGRSELTKKTRERMDRVHQEVCPLMRGKEETERKLKELDAQAFAQSNYISKWVQFPVYENTKTKYYRSGEEMFPAMLEALEQAEHYIFLEYFILDAGKMFDKVVEVLERKVKEGVEVRLIYDDMGCI